MTIKIEVKEKDLEALKLLSKRYYFGIFKEICLNDEDEYIYRDAIINISKSFEDKKRTLKREDWKHDSKRAIYLVELGGKTR